MEPKTGFESGSSPTISENGAPVLTGRGLQDARERIRSTFEQVHGGQPHRCQRRGNHRLPRRPSGSGSMNA